jgi:hypothetical protein
VADDVDVIGDRVVAVLADGVEMSARLGAQLAIATQLARPNATQLVTTRMVGINEKPQLR